MDQTTFDTLARLFASTRSRRAVLKGIVGGGALATAALAQRIEPAGAQCLEDGEECTLGTECCSGACSASLGVCVTIDQCVADGDPCSDGTECCSGACSASIGVCVTMDQCVAAGDPCTDGAECCSGSCSASMGVCVGDGECLADNEVCTAGADCCSGYCDNAGYCSTPENTCIEDGGLCQAGRYCCSGLDCAPGGHCPASDVSVLPATGTGDGGHGSTAGLMTPIAALGAAALVGARRLRAGAQDDTTS